MKNQNIPVGIDDISLYVPKLFLPIKTLAEVRGFNYDKLNKGLGLEKMAVPDVHEDTATMAANAVADLIEKNKLSPKNIGRIYLGTESALDGSKPTATYVIEMLHRKYQDRYGENCFLNCDVVDMTFACVGGVDALHNTLDWVRGGTNKIGIVVCADHAKYELESSGEYTQGAGAIALLVKQQPRLIAIQEHFGIATMGEHDFYKPTRQFSKQHLIKEVLDLAGIGNISAAQVLQQLPNSLEVSGLLDSNEDYISVHKDTPVFDGPFSNLTYQNRIREAYQNLRSKLEEGKNLSTDNSILDRWARIIFHLPYAAHGKRIFSEIFMIEKKIEGAWDQVVEQVGIPEPTIEDFQDSEQYAAASSKFLRMVTKTIAYKTFVKEKMGSMSTFSGQVGNMYTCSIFLALMSTLENDFVAGKNLEGQFLSFWSYGSGSKSKVFEGIIQPGWQSVVARLKTTNKLDLQKELNYVEYEALHRKQLINSVLTPHATFAIAKIERTGTEVGTRYYKWVGSKMDQNSPMTTVQTYALNKKNKT